MFLLVLLAGLGLWWLGRRWQREQSTIASLRNVGAKVIVEPIGPDWLDGVLGGAGDSWQSGAGHSSFIV